MKSKKEAWDRYRQLESSVSLEMFQELRSKLKKEIRRGKRRQGTALADSIQDYHKRFYVHTGNNGNQSESGTPQESSS